MYKKSIPSVRPSVCLSLPVYQPARPRPSAPDSSPDPPTPEDRGHRARAGRTKGGGLGGRRRLPGRAAGGTRRRTATPSDATWYCSDPGLGPWGPWVLGKPLAICMWLATSLG